jgi:hypothetical protein
MAALPDEPSPLSNCFYIDFKESQLGISGKPEAFQPNGVCHD